ncbi:hypothetical protein NLG97_g9916 [Lecanicillium saksenae]|uniref:Uncharacterized protein n=1 Tax=Lecanicillium saksenae TaxID=468837 RepID=A0ACC1QHW9_9HYPO|nr:hypothetical protein NLG97_g9916 [Lecanicillium saksenae]
MPPRSLCEPPAGSWHSLPAEVRNMILRIVVTKRDRGWGSQAAVSKEWQRFLEPVNFARLDLLVGCLEQFGSVVPPDSERRLLVRYICLNISLPSYDLRFCSDAECCQTNYDETLKSALRALYVILQQWRLEGMLSLEFNVLSMIDDGYPSTRDYADFDRAGSNACADLTLAVWTEGRVVRELDACVLGKAHFILAKGDQELGFDIVDMKYAFVAAPITNNGDAIYHLKLSGPVITPKSLWKARREAYVYAVN